MKTAEEMIMELDSALLFNDVKKLMIQYAKEALEEAANKAKSRWLRYGEYMGHEVDRQSILDLINKLK